MQPNDREDALRLAREAEIAVGITGGNPSPEKVERFYQLCRDKSAEKDWEVPAAKLVEWLYCMSYNDSYFGEPAGLVKRATAELNRLLPSMTIIAEPASTEGATPHCPAQFINVLIDEGTKEGAINQLQQTWNERCKFERQRNELRERVKELEAWLDHIAAPNDPNRTELLAKEGTKP